METNIEKIKKCLWCFLVTNSNYIQNDLTIYSTDSYSIRRLRNIYEVDARQNFIDLLCKLEMVDKNAFYEEISISRLYIYFSTPSNAIAINRAFNNCYETRFIKRVTSEIEKLALEMDTCLAKIIDCIPKRHLKH